VPLAGASTAEAADAPIKIGGEAANAAAPIRAVGAAAARRRRAPAPPTSAHAAAGRTSAVPQALPTPTLQSLLHLAHRLLLLLEEGCE
jgi:hypothetical protein